MIDISIVGPLKFTCMRRSRASMHFCSSVLSSFALCLWTQEFQANMKVIRGLLWKLVFRSNFILILTNCKKVAYYKLNHIWPFFNGSHQCTIKIALSCTVLYSDHRHDLQTHSSIEEFQKNFPLKSSLSPCGVKCVHPKRFSLCCNLTNATSFQSHRNIMKRVCLCRFYFILTYLLFKRLLALPNVE